jgi:hypothetical protein
MTETLFTLVKPAKKELAERGLRELFLELQNLHLIESEFSAETTPIQTIFNLVNDADGYHVIRGQLPRLISTGSLMLPYKTTFAELQEMLRAQLDADGMLEADGLLVMPNAVAGLEVKLCLTRGKYQAFACYPVATATSFDVLIALVTKINQACEGRLLHVMTCRSYRSWARAIEIAGRITHLLHGIGG